MTDEKTQAGLLKAVSELRSGDRSDHLYDQWAGRYDEDLIDNWGYIAPRIAAEALAAVCPDRATGIIDLGCGTGLSGAALATLGYRTIDGLDVSAGMLAEAGRKGLYGKLIQGDLTARTPLPDAAYGAALCVGSMGAGHVEPAHLPELLRPLEPGATLVLYMNAHYHDEGDYAGQFRRHQEAGLWTIERTERSNYMEALDRPGWLIVGRRAA